MIDLKQGDCLEILKDIPDNSIDLTVTSPPYDNLRSYNDNIDQWCFEKFQLIAKELYRVTKEGGVIVWIVNDATIAGSETGTILQRLRILLARYDDMAQTFPLPTQKQIYSRF